MYPDFNLPLVVHTDANKEGLDAVLYQKQEEILRVVGYASRSLDAAEKNYHSSKLEFLALKWALCEKFKPYVFYAPHTLVVTDNNPLTYISTTAKLTATGQRWVNELAEFKFSIQYRSGKSHIDADFLSRYPLPINEYLKYCDMSVSPSEISAIVCGLKYHPVIPARICPVQGSMGEKESNINLKAEQEKDETIQTVMDIVKSGKRLSTKELKQCPADVISLLKNWSKLRIDNKGILCRVSGNRRQVILPKGLRELVYKELHSKMGHLGVDRVTDLARERCFWPHMARDIQDFITKKCKCLIDKRPNVGKDTPMGTITSSSPLELVSIDFVHLETASGGYQYILTVVDHYTRFLQTYATRNKSALTAAKILYNEYIPRFGIPEKILHDQGTEFNNKLFKELNALCGIKQLRTTPYHPMGNGQCERMNGTILSMLRTLEESQKSKWKEHLTKLNHAYNCTRNSATGFSPFYLMFGREPRLPIDAILGLHEENSRDFVNHWQTAMKEAYSIASQRSNARKERDQIRRNSKNVSDSLHTNDRVLLRNLSERGGPGKLRSYWESTIYKVLSEVGDTGVVYEIQREDGKGKKKVVHRNLLMPCHELIFHMEEGSGKSKGGRKAQKVKQQLSSFIGNESEIRDTDDENLAIGPVEFNNMLFRLEDETANHRPNSSVASEETVVEIVPLDTDDSEANDDESNGERIENSMPDGDDLQGDVSQEIDTIVNPDSEEDSCDTDQQDSEVSQSSESESDNDTEPLRRSERSRIPKKIFTYDQLGGEPSINALYTSNLSHLANEFIPRNSVSKNMPLPRAEPFPSQPSMERYTLQNVSVTNMPTDQPITVYIPLSFYQPITMYISSGYSG